ALLTPRGALAQELQPPPPMAPFPQQQQQPQYGAPQYGQQPQYGSQYGTQPQQQQPMPQSNGSTTTQQLDAAEREDSGRGLEFFYANAGVGASYLGLSASPRSTALGLQKMSGAGLAVDAGLGVRLLTFTVGPRVRWNALSSFTMWQLDLEAATHIPYGKIDGYFGIHGGYAFTGKISDDSVIAVAGASPLSGSDVSVHGLDLGLQAGADYYVTPNFSLGFEFGGQAYFLSRSASSASSVGLGAQLGAHAGLHF
ncbi:MAG: hypothetical protein ABIP39_08220, partial [Polyangiaceae bacterium]